MDSFSDIARRVMRLAGHNLARSEREGLGPQPVELIPGMTAAPEPCLLFDAWTADAHPSDGVAQPKKDGIRALCLQAKIVTRQALPFDAALHCLPALHRLEARMGEPMVFDGEYQEPEGFDATLTAFKRGKGIGTFFLFDAIPYREWSVNRFSQPLSERMARIAECVTGDEPFLQFMPPSPCNHPGDAKTLAMGAWARNEEGIVVKSASSLYYRGRATSWLKLKRVETLDGVVTDVIVPDGDVERGVALVRAGGINHRVAAMPADVRAMLRADMVGGLGGGLTGRMVELAYNDRTEKGKLRGARIVRLRPDKEKGN